MPKDYRARIGRDIWGDDDWLDLTPEAQHLYFVLYTGSVSFCGSGEWHPGKIAQKARGWTVEGVLKAADELIADLFVLIDSTTDEFLLRSWIKHDRLYRIQNMAVSIANARAALASRDLRGVVVHEVLKLRASEPALDSWNRDQVRQMLAQNPIDPASLDRSSPWVSPSDRGSVSPKDSPSVSPPSTGLASPGASSRATPSPSPAPNSNSTTEAAQPRGTRVDPDWKPDPEVIDQIRADCPNLDLAAEHKIFVDFWLAKSGKDATKVDWNATWRGWMRREAKKTAPANNGKPVHKMRAYAELAAQVRAEEQLAATKELES